jgi:hypothetical protein
VMEELVYLLGEKKERGHEEVRVSSDSLE